MTDWHSRFRFPAWRHQAREFDERRDKKAHFLLWQMRTGKTKACIDLACYLYETGQIDGVIIAAPNNVHANWVRKELPKHLWSGVPGGAVAWSSEDSRDVRWDMAFDELMGRDGLVWFSVNREALSMARFKPYLQRFLKKRKRFLLIVDEVHDLSRRLGTKSSKAVRGLRDRAVAIRALSGTVTDNDPRHAFPQYEVLAPQALGFKTQDEFNGRYCEFEDIYVAGGRVIKNGRVSGYVRQDELRERLAPWTSQVLRDEVDDMPELVPDDVEFDMTPQQKAIYNDVCRGAIVKLDTGEYISPSEGGALIVRLQQIASGWVVDRESGEVLDVVPPDQNPRLLALRAQLALCGPKTIIWCRFVEDVHRVYDAVKSWGYMPVHYYGGTSKKDRPRFEDRFMRDPRCGPMVAQPQACGQGLDFSAATDILWYSHVHGNLIVRRQADERATQKGGRKIGLGNMKARGTVDDKMLADFEAKAERSDYLTGDGLRRFLQLVM